MPYTKRLPHYTSPKQLLNYILDEKHNGERATVTSSINCNVETALQEFQDINKRYKTTGNRVAYHLIQSFHPDDKITAEQANKIAKKMCEEIYPDFQCVIVTHTDTAHINNHICINSTNIYGRKLEDRLANEKEGLYGFTLASDKIANEYGCFIMPPRYIKHVKNKNNYYFDYVEHTWRDRIRADINEVKVKINSLDELIEELITKGYEIRRGKYISLKAFGMAKYVRLYSLGDAYKEENINQYFINKCKEVELDEIGIEPKDFNKDLVFKTKESREAIIKSQLAAKGKEYSEYQQTKYKEIKRFYQLKNQLEYLNEREIRSFNDLENQIKEKRKNIKNRNIELKKIKSQIHKHMEIANKAQDYICLKKVYEYAMFYKQLDVEYVLPEEAEVFLKLQDELRITSVEEAKDLVIASRPKRLKMNEIKKEMLELQRELNHLDTIKEEQLSKSELYINHIKFGGNRIDYAKSSDDYWYLHLPYTHEYLKIEKEFTAYNEKLKTYTLYLVDDKQYELLDEEEQVVSQMSGVDLCNHVLQAKKINDNAYQK